LIHFYKRGERTKMDVGRANERKVSQRKLSTDFVRKLSAISVASDVSCISGRFGMEQDQLRSIMQDILELDLNDDWELGSDDGMSEYGDDRGSEDLSLWQELQNETVTLDQRKTSSSSEASTDSLDRAEDFHPVQINLGEVKTVLSMYQKHKVSVGSLTGQVKKI
jgi:hypothetical protein